jgi:hypothetical protein
MLVQYLKVACLIVDTTAVTVNNVFKTGNSFSLAYLVTVIFLDYSTVKYRCYKKGNKYVHITLECPPTDLKQSKKCQIQIANCKKVRDDRRMEKVT